jgi:predicted acetyltransferase
MMRQQLADLRARGESVAVLLSSEAPIYGRSGYGPATYTSKLTLTRHEAALAAPRARGAAPAPETGSAGVVRRDGCGDVLEEVYDRHRRAQPGALSRPHRWWERRAGQPPVSPAPRHIAVHRDAEGTPDGYASYAVESGTLTVDEIITTDDAVFNALVRYVLGHDLVSKVVLRHVPADHPLRWQLADFRAAEAGGVTDWLRVLGSLTCPERSPRATGPPTANSSSTWTTPSSASTAGTC